MEADFEILGTSQEAAKVRAFVADAVKTHLPVLLLGETGTGKTFVAQCIHRRSLRAQGPFVAVDLGTIPSPLIHSELFGCKKGAFTGAEERKGLVRTAHGGTLFLDEIGDAPLEVQACLLQLVDQRRVRALGGERFESVDCRIMAATKADLKAKVVEGSFREDLLYRLRGHVLRLPPLRQRGEDVLIVARRWLAAQSAGHVRLSPQAARLMLQHAWPGNFRELFYRLEAALGKCKDGTIEPDHLGLPATDPGLSFPQAHRAATKTQARVTQLVDQLVAEILAGQTSLPDTLEQLETKAISLAIEKTESLRAAARVLQVPYSSLQTKLAKLAKKAG